LQADKSNFIIAVKKETARLQDALNSKDELNISHFRQEFARLYESARRFADDLKICDPLSYVKVYLETGERFGSLDIVVDQLREHLEKLLSLQANQ
jgi:hypothetical protein